MRLHRLGLATALLTTIAAAGTAREALASQEGEAGALLEFSHPLYSNTPQPERVLRFHYLVEFDGQHDLGGEEDGFDMVNISPGIKYQVLDTRKLYLGVSVRLPLTQDKKFYVAPRFSVFYHF